ncbi:MAG: Gfo/Idh/MocA family protein [Spirochaetota bacterium]
MADTIRVGMAGYGAIGRVHSLNYRQLPIIYGAQLPTPVLQRVATSRDTTAAAAREEAGFLYSGTDLEQSAAAADVDMVDVTVPNHLHLQVVEAALGAGKAVYCEKPLAASAEQARKIARAASASRSPFGMVFQYRFVPAMLRAKELMDEGRLGRVFTFRGEYLHSGYQNPNRPLTWRTRKEEGGSGALGDLGSHVIDLVRYLLGEFGAVQGQLETFVSERPVAKGATETGVVTVDDVAWFRARMNNGAVGTVEASRVATGTLDTLRLWIHGEKGALHFDLMDPSFLYLFEEQRSGGDYGGDRGWQRLETVTHYPGAATPPPRAPFGWARAHAENQYRFIKAVRAGNEPSPGIVDGLRAQLVMDAVERSAEAEGAWTTVELS